jgi:hypothetical protein
LGLRVGGIRPRLFVIPTNGRNLLPRLFLETNLPPESCNECGLGDYAASMAGFLFLLPTILLWTLTLVAGAAIGWRALRWAARLFFHIPKAAKTVS